MLKDKKQKEIEKLALKYRDDDKRISWDTAVKKATRALNRFPLCAQSSDEY